MGMGMVLLPSTVAMDEVAATLDAPVARYDGIHDAESRSRRGDVACIVVDAAAGETASDVAVRRFRRGGSTAVVLAVDPGDGAAAVGAGVTAVVDRTAPEATARRLDEIRTDELLDRSAHRSSDAETLVREVAGAVRNDESGDIESRLDEVVTSLGASDPYPVVWAGRLDTERRVVRPCSAAGIPTAHLRSVPVGNAEGAGSDEDGAEGATRRAVAGSSGAEVFAEPLGDGGEAETVEDGTHLLALRIPTNPVAVLHLVAERPGGVPTAERWALVALGSAVAAAQDESGDGDRGAEDRVRLLADALAHELSNQLGAASLQLDLARDHGDGEHFDHVARALGRLEGLTEETRALARAEPDLEWTDLGEVARSAWAAISTPNASLQVEDATLEGDTALLRLAVLNLLRNAVEHGQPETGDDESDDSPGLRVEIGPVGEEGFYVADDGPGIPEAERDRVLEWGHSGGDGTGVGLGLVRLVADRHGWVVAVEESEAGGARVVLGPDASR